MKEEGIQNSESRIQKGMQAVQGRQECLPHIARAALALTAASLASHSLKFKFQISDLRFQISDFRSQISDLKFQR